MQALLLWLAVGRQARLAVLQVPPLAVRLQLWQRALRVPPVAVLRQARRQLAGRLQAAPAAAEQQARRRAGWAAVAVPWQLLHLRGALHLTLHPRNRTGEHSG